MECKHLTDLPCCNNESAVDKFCFACIKTYCEGEGGVAACPKCRTTIKVENMKVVKSEMRGHCRMCNHKDMVLVVPNLCANCKEGVSNPLNYECNRCHNTQRIPHPMYRYQSTPDAYGTASWACHQACGDYTMWRIKESDMGKVPEYDIPTSWPGYVEERMKAAKAHYAKKMSDLEK